MKRIVVQTHDFDVADEYNLLTKDNTCDGAVVFFVGRMRDFSQNTSVTALHLEHYPEMVDNALKIIVNKAFERFNISRCSLIHRVGKIEVKDQIVFVGTSGPHRESAFQAAQFIMDYLKSEAPFWKKEITCDGNSFWTEANNKDSEAIQKWSSD